MQPSRDLKKLQLRSSSSVQHQTRSSYQEGPRKDNDRKSHLNTLNFIRAVDKRLVKKLVQIFERARLKIYFCISVDLKIFF
jgi:hypothetical protein